LVLKSWFAEKTSSDVRLAALSYLAELGDLDALPMVEAEAQSGAKETVGSAIEAGLRILLRHDEHRAAIYLVSTSFETISTKVLEAALPVIAQLGLDDLTKGLDHRAPEVRARTVDILGERGMLQFDTIDRAKIDESPIVRLAAVKALDRLGQPLSLDEVEETLCRSRKATYFLSTQSDRDGIGEVHFDLYRIQRLRNMAVQPLKALLGAERHRDAAYRILAARRIEEYGKKLRGDIEDDFKRYFAHYWPLGIPQAKNVGLLGIGRQDPNAAKRCELVREALDVIAEQRIASDLELIRSILDRKIVTPSTAVLSYLQTFGDGNDIARVGETSRYTWPSFIIEPFGTTFDMAARLILRWTADRVDDPRIVALPDEMRTRTVELVPPTRFAKLTDEAVLDLLLSDYERLRRASAMQTAASLSRVRIRKVLAVYEADPQGIYYLVRHWLDLGLAFPIKTARRVVAASWID
jgi:HEAT repeat protein